ncbi:chemotaxis-specific protein-glutamate methyltransferase CheB [Myxococcota bacterium]|nr:chemotaxis-specific protein-glutamate methyltransferase CheB [Myxococcota bacterium]
MERIRVLVVDDSTVVRRIVAKVLGDDPRIEVVGAVANGQVALEKLESLRPDLLTLDLEMPVMGGLETLAQLRARGIKLPVIVFSAADQAGAAGALEALQAGASDYVTKPSQLARIADALDSLREELIPKIVALIESAGRAKARSVVKVAPVTQVTQVTQVTPVSPAPAASVAAATGAAPQLIVIGTSTGGPKVLQAILPELPASYPIPILVVQHMPPAFTATLAKSLDQRCKLRVHEAWEGAEAKAGEVWIAPGDYHMTLERTANGCRIHLDQGPKENSCRPAVDPLFRSAATVFGARALGVVLTGMGSDGLEGTRALRKVGARVVVQDEATATVWGMPGAVANAGLASQILPQGEVALFLERCVAMRAVRMAAGTR